MVGAADRADADLDGLHAEAGEIIERLLEGFVAKDDGEDAEFHEGMDYGW